MTQRRSFVHSRLLAADAQFADMNGGQVAMTAGAHDTLTTAKRMAVADLSLLPRAGYKGNGAPAWLKAQELQLPAQPNSAVRQADDSLLVALSVQEHLLLASPLLDENDGLCRRLTGAWSLDSAKQCYQLPRADSHCWFAVCGQHVGAMLAKLCGVDLRLPQFPVYAVAQTSLARINAIIIRCPLGETPAFYLLADSACAEYLWDCLLDAMAEFEGAPIGLKTLRGLENS